MNAQRDEFSLFQNGILFARGGELVIEHRLLKVFGSHVHARFISVQRQRNEDIFVCAEIEFDRTRFDFYPG